MAGKKETADLIRDYEQCMNALRSEIRITQSNIENPSFVERSIADLRASIARQTKQLQDFEASMESGPERITALRGQIADIAKKVLYLRHRREIEKLLELQGKINDNVVEDNG